MRFAGFFSKVMESGGLRLKGKEAKELGRETGSLISGMEGEFIHSDGKCMAMVGLASGLHGSELEASVGQNEAEEIREFFEGMDEAYGGTIHMVVEAGGARKAAETVAGCILFSMGKENNGQKG